MKSIQVKHPARAGALVLENCHQKFRDAADYKEKSKKDPNIATSYISDCWAKEVVGDLNDKNKHGARWKGVKGKIVLLWPCHSGGKQDAQKKCPTSKMGDTVAAALKTKVVDSYGFTDADVAAQISRVVQPK